jgi:hypothetical protein
MKMILLGMKSMQRNMKNEFNKEQGKLMVKIILLLLVFMTLNSCRKKDELDKREYFFLKLPINKKMIMHGKGILAIGEIKEEVNFIKQNILPLAIHFDRGVVERDYKKLISK